MFFILCETDRFPIRAGAPVQLRNSETWNSLVITQIPETLEKTFSVYSSYGNSKETCFWTFQINGTVNDNNNKTIGDSIQCSSLISIYSAPSSASLEASGTKIQFTKMNSHDPKTLWKVICQNGTVWNRAMIVSFFNEHEKCYLATSLEKPEKIGDEIRYPLFCSKKAIPGIAWDASHGLFLAN